MTLIAPEFTIEQAQFVSDLMNEVPLVGLERKALALGAQAALGQATPYEPPEPEAPAEAQEQDGEPAAGTPDSPE